MKGKYPLEGIITGSLVQEIIVAQKLAAMLNNTETEQSVE